MYLTGLERSAEDQQSSLFDLFIINDKIKISKHSCFFTLSLMTNNSNKLECLSLKSLSSLALYLEVKLEPTQVQHKGVEL
jgi:hypothetical protein